MGNAVSLSQADIQGSLTGLQARIRAGASVNKRMFFPKDVGPLPKGCKCTPLGYAILSGNLGLLDTLLSFGADVNKPVGLPDRFVLTPLQLAVALGAVEAVRRLLERGADPNAALQPKRATITLLQPSQHRHRPAATAGIRASREGANVSSNIPSAFPLSLLIPGGLLSMRAGDAALHIAIDCAVEERHHCVTPGSASGCRMKMIETLIGHPSTDLNRPNGRRRTPLYKACKRQLELVVALLATHPRVDVNAGWPLFAAIKVENLQLVRVLLQAGAGPTCGVYNIDGHTPLSYALFGCSSDNFYDRAAMVEMLLQAGSHVEPKMLSYAAERNWHAVLVALRSVAASPPSSSAVGLAVGSGGHGGDGIVNSASGGQQPGLAMAGEDGTAALSRPAPSSTQTKSMFSAGLMHRLVRARQSSLLHSRSGRSRENGVSVRGSGSIGGGSPAAAASTWTTAGRSGGGSRTSGNGVTTGNGGGGRSDSRLGGSNSSWVGTSAADVASAGPARRGVLRLKFPSRWPSSPQRQPLRLSGMVGKNPIMILFAPLLIPILILEPIFIALGEIVKLLVLILAVLVVVVAPVLVYGMYRLSRGLVRLLYYNRSLQNTSLVPSERSSETTDAPAQNIPSFHEAAASLSQLLVPEKILSDAALGAAAAGGDAVDRGSTRGVTSRENGNAAAVVGLLRDGNNWAAVAGPSPADGSELLRPTKHGDSHYDLIVSSPPLSSLAPLRELDGLEESTFRHMSSQHPPQQLSGAAWSVSPAGALDAAAPAAPAATVPGANVRSDITSNSTGDSILGGGNAVDSGSSFSSAMSGSNGSAAGRSSAVHSNLASNLSSGGLMWSHGSLLGSFFSGDIELLELLWRLGLDFCVILVMVIFTVVAVTYLDAFMEFHLARILPADSTLQMCMRGRAVNRFGDLRDFSANAFSEKERKMLARLFLGLLIVRWFGGAPVWVLTGSVVVFWLGCLLIALFEDYCLLRVVRGLAEIHESGGGNDARSHGSEVAGGTATATQPQSAVGARNGGDPLPAGVASAVAAAAVAVTETAATAASAGCRTNGSKATDGLDGLCCVCMSNRAVMGFVHREVVHCCLCEECEGVLRSRRVIAKCLICKQPASVVAKVVVT
ncbi:hypothetical protein Vretimale_12979 [Volvox reticuliferus]|uniref:Uncharacterized protein n=1 Tax=Volvox reticuliferus TaxID=1737510 RepID=A0A8J4CCF2_9CHLO|nr:hypothetical protein Vretifemale_9360 [Volvox reticuliferus]GIM09114.1 hypothetical protein Vretimale_12979 [Volvox reticuliferus]